MNQRTPLRAVEQEEPQATEHSGGGNGGGSRLEERLRGVEIQLAEIKAKLDTELKCMGAWRRSGGHGCRGDDRRGHRGGGSPRIFRIGIVDKRWR